MPARRTCSRDLRSYSEDFLRRSFGNSVSDDVSGRFLVSCRFVRTCRDDLVVSMATWLMMMVMMDSGVTGACD